MKIKMRERRKVEIRDGNRGAVDSDQGSGTDSDETAPYELKWEGDVDRAPMFSAFT